MEQKNLFTEIEVIQQILLNLHDIPNEKVTLDTKLNSNLDLDSLDRVELVMAMEKHYSITISDKSIQSLDTFSVRQLVEIVKKTRG